MHEMKKESVHLTHFATIQSGDVSDLGQHLFGAVLAATDEVRIPAVLIDEEGGEVTVEAKNKADSSEQRGEDRAVQGNRLRNRRNHDFTV